MGQFKFRIPIEWRFETGDARTVHVVGLEGIPRPCNVRFSDNILTVTRNQSESGKTYVSYPFSKRGSMTICTGTLLESDRVYDLSVELARGTLNRIRNQASIWQEGGLSIPELVESQITSSTNLLSEAIVSGLVEKKDQLSGQCLELAIEALFGLCQHFGMEISRFRVGQHEMPSFWMATSQHNATEKIQDCFDLEVLSINDENKESTNVSKIIGPILDSTPKSEFVSNCENFDEGRSRLLANLDEKLNDLPNGVALIHAACGLNGIGQRNLSYRQQLQLTTEILSRIDDSCHSMPALVSLDYPWSEKLAWSVGGIHPLQIADDLMRGGAKIDYIGLDINLDYWPCGSAARDPLQWIDTIDLWCQLGLPLILCLRVPCGVSFDESVKGCSEFNVGAADNVTIALDSQLTKEQEKSSPSSFANSIRQNLTENQRLELIETILPMLVARPGIHGLIWRQSNDDDDVRFPDAGLYGEFGERKPIMKLLKKLRAEILMR